ncbi:MAG: response regulator [Dehalococcoidia bacterium]
MSENIRVLIADDHPLIREGLRGLLAAEPDLELVGEAADGSEAVEKTDQLRPDVIVLDLLMPVKSGIEAIIEIKEKDPVARILVLTSFADDEQLFPALRAGALGYLLKDSSPQDLLRAIRSVYRGESSLHPAIARRLVLQFSQPAVDSAPENPLTQREVEVLKLVAEGLSNQNIADELVVSERTVGKHVGNILEKLHLANRTQAALYALREGLSTLEPKGEEQ